MLFQNNSKLHGRPLMPSLRPLPSCHRHLTPPSPFSAFQLPFNASAASSMSLPHSLMHLHQHLTYCIRPLTPFHRPLTSLRRHLTLLLAYKGLRITLQCPPFSPVNPLSPHDAIKHLFTSLKTDLIFLQQRVLERKFP